ncbi:DNA-repair protein XRCC3 [Angomonas deanei]|nr:DNA-repair protein XRCC3 [Angomonas deanei]|eukprot:EPY30655.1 DNA-repair protein XRCC3 [Angomonas deanei]
MTAEEYLPILATRQSAVGRAVQEKTPSSVCQVMRFVEFILGVVAEVSVAEISGGIVPLHQTVGGDPSTFTYTCGCPTLDTVLPLLPGTITAVSGAAGCGKTQLALQCLMETIVRGLVRNVETKCIYLVSEDVPIARLGPLAHGALVRNSETEDPPHFTVERVLSQLQIKKISDLDSLIHLFTSDTLRTVVGGKDRQGIVVLDSIAAVVQNAADDASENAHEWSAQSEKISLLGSLIVKFLDHQRQMCLVVTNQIRTAPRPQLSYLKRRRPGPEYVDVAALGIGWAVFPHHHVMLSKSKHSNRRMCVLHASPSMGPGKVHFTITNDGLERE